MSRTISFRIVLMLLFSIGISLVSCEPEQILFNESETPLIDALTEEEEPEEEEEEPEEEPEEEGAVEPTGELSDKAGWSIAGFSSEETGGGENTGLAAAIIDGDIETYWHSCYSGDCAEATHPHTITVDMGAVLELGGLEFVQRQSATRQVNEFDVEVSTDNETFTPVGSFTLEDGNLASQPIGFTPVSAQYFKIVINSTHDGDRFAALAEVNAYVSGSTGGGNQPTGALASDRSAWTIADFSTEQEAGENTGLATAVLDGDLETYWHSCYSGACGGAVHPHHITIDLAEEFDVSGLQFAQRQTLSRAVNEISIEVSTDNQTFTSVGNFALENIADLQTIAFNAITARYVKVIMNSSHDGDRFASMAEINAYLADATGGGGTTSSLADRTNWVMASFSSEETSGEGETGRAADVLDGDLNTYWHTCWTCSPETVFPHELIIDMAQTESVSGLEISQRQTLSRAVEGITIEVSEDNASFTEVGSFTLENDSASQTISFSAVSARYIKIISTSAYDGDRFAALSEINAYIE